MAEGEVVHAAPERGRTFSPCCDRTWFELPVHERVTHDPRQVTCGRLTAADELLLTGHSSAAIAPRAHATHRPRSADWSLSSERHHAERLLFELALSVRSLCGSSLSLQTAFEKVQAASLQVAPPDVTAVNWSAATMVKVTARAMELAGH
jgi:hypothetical protein